jgi:hypothetical protein
MIPIEQTGCREGTIVEPRCRAGVEDTFEFDGRRRVTR